MTDQLKQPSEAATWPREIWMAEREEHDQGVVTAVLSEFATVARWEGDKERDREFHHYIDADIHESSERYHKARYTALEAQLTEAREKELTWRKVAQSATPGGSEYMDPEYTRKHISQQRERLHNAMKAKVLAERELTEARAREAVAYEVAADIAVKQEAACCDWWQETRTHANVYEQLPEVASQIRALTPDDTTTALEQIKQEADKAGFERGVKKAAEICRKHTYQPPNTFLNHCTMRKDHREDIEAAILATLSEPKENSDSSQ